MRTKTESKKGREMRPRERFEKRLLEMPGNGPLKGCSGVPKRDSSRSPKRIENGCFEGLCAVVGNGLPNGSLGGSKRIRKWRSYVVCEFWGNFVQRKIG